MKLKSGIFRVERRQKTPAVGLLLVAQPFFTDEYFHRSVICIIENDDVHGTMGLVLNNCSSLKLNDLFPELKELPEIPLFFGGPVSSDQLYYVHVWESIPGAIEIVPGLYIGGDFEMVKGYLKQTGDLDSIRFFIGYSGWSPCQLEKEIEDGVWAVSDMLSPATCLQGEGDKFWRKVVASMDADYRKWLACPPQPYYN